MLRILANENMPGEAVQRLRDAGHDVTWIRTDAPGSKDPAILARSMSEGRILITFDKDFGELAFRARLPAKCGIVLFRIPTASPTQVARDVMAAMESRTDWAGNFAVVEPGRIRMTLLS